MIRKIAHLADIHIRKSPVLHEMYVRQFNLLYDDLRKNKPDLITIAGDLYHDYIDLSGEAQLLMASFLNNLTRIAPVVITRGNHDLQKKNLSRVDVIQTVTQMINNPKITYYNKTGFYQYDNITFAVWNHRDRELRNPWEDKTHIKDKNQIYIDLFHDPISGCLSHNGEPMKDLNYFSVSDFKGDFTMMGDIHLYQKFGKLDNVVYPSSLIQQNFGEHPYGHGYVMWDIVSKTHDFIEITNEHTYINFELSENTDYDNLNLSSKYIKSEPEIKVKWRDIKANVNRDNEIKIRKYIKEKYGLDKLVVERFPIYTNISDIQMVNEGINVNDLSVQRAIFEEYLKANGYDVDFIKEVLKIDDLVNSRLDVNSERVQIEWRIESFWFDNFKSYGDGNIIDWNYINGIIQIHGENQQGKTTILDAITYILYGITTSTTKEEKFGDNRFINNKRDLDYCKGGSVLNINGEKYTMFRKTERKWKRNKADGIGSINSILEFYRGTEMKPENLINGEQDKDTQKLINDALGNFKDFIRLALTTADNLNDLLSVDRSIFVDSLIKDAGYDIFETKMSEYKSIQKEEKDERVTINVLEEETKIETYNNQIAELTKSKDEIDSKIIEVKGFKDQRNKEKESKIKELHKVDEDLQGINIETLNKNIVFNNTKIQENKDSIIKIDTEITGLPSTFDHESFNKKSADYDDKKNKITTLRIEVTELGSSIKTYETNLSQIDEKISNIVKEKVTEINTEIAKITNNIENKKKDVIQLVKDNMADLKAELQTCGNEIQNLTTKQDSLKENATKLKDEISDLENSKNCITCGRPLDSLEPEHIEHIRERVNKIKEDLTKLQDQYNLLETNKKPYRDKSKYILEKSEKIKNKNFEDDEVLKVEYDNALLFINKNEEIIKKHNTDIELLNQNLLESFDDIQQKIKSIKDNENTYRTKLTELTASKNTKTEEGVKLTTESNTLKEEVEKLKITKENFESRKDKVNTKEKLALENDNLSLKTKNDKMLIDKYNSQKGNILENESIQLLIDAIEEKMAADDVIIESFNTQRDDVIKDIPLVELNISNIEKNIEKYKEQIRKDEISNAYLKAVHRDGIPTFLLKKSIELLNTDLNNLLTNVDFTVFFDDELKLRLSTKNRLDVSQNAIESSGKERTFIAVALKIALRKINTNSKCDFIIFDEIMGKLLNNSVDQFIEFLTDISKNIGKLIIIEHNHPIPYDALIEVAKDEEGVSTLTLV
jgi:DNA repair exonuclease SbcCD ATPase subunit/DNA repair exonuclease SbcCD nuclease subunit